MCDAFPCMNCQLDTGMLDDEDAVDLTYRASWRCELHNCTLLEPLFDHSASLSGQRSIGRLAVCPLFRRVRKPVHKTALHCDPPGPLRLSWHFLSSIVVDM